MYTVRQLLTIVLAAGIGLALLARPDLVLRLQAFTAGPTTGHRGEYGSEPAFEGWMVWAARGFGVLALAAAAFVLVQPHL